MAFPHPLATLALITVATLAISTVNTQGVDGAVTPTQDEMARIATAGDEGPEHRHLFSVLGTWSVERREWRDPKQPKPAITTALCENAAILGGRFLRMNMSWRLGTRLMESMTLAGCDRRSGEYTLLALDSTRTWVDNARGKWNPNKRSILLDATDENPLTKQTTETSIIFELGKPDTWKMTVYKAVRPTGSDEVAQRFKALELIGTKKAATRPGR